MSEFGSRCGGVAALVLGAGLLAAGAVGCQQKQPAAATAERQMSDAKVRAVVEADAVISQGEREVADAADLRAKDPASADRLNKQGEDDITRGQAMKSRAAAMK